MMVGIVLGQVTGKVVAPGTATAIGSAVPAGWVGYTEWRMFSFQGPAGLKKENLIGVDSYVGRYEGAGMKISFALGREYGGGATLPDAVAVVIDGRKGELLKDEGGVQLVVHDLHGFAESPTGLSLQVMCEAKMAGQAEVLLRSVKIGPGGAFPIIGTGPAGTKPSGGK
jgi:hypothetical protein